MNDLVAQIRKHIDTAPKAIAALQRLEEQLTDAKTYDEVRQMKREAEAIKILFSEVAEVKHQAEETIAEIVARIGEELAKLKPVPGKRTDLVTCELRGSTDKQAATDGNRMKASRLQQLHKLGKKRRKALVKELHDKGKDATPSAILAAEREQKQTAKRAEYRARVDVGGTVKSLYQLSEQKRFNAIYIDPPWKFEVYSGEGKKRSADRHYDTKEMQQIMDLPVGMLADKDCALFMWCVLPCLPEALQVLDAWEFAYKTVAFTWVKTTKNAEVIKLNGDGLHWGMGYWTRANTEVCILATRGSPTRLAMDVHQVTIAPVGEHSAKPEETARRIERLVGGPYLELYARRARKGWFSWGNELLPQLEAAE